MRVRVTWLPDDQRSREMRARLKRAPRHAWRVYADPAKSDAALVLKWMIPLEIAAWHYRVLAPDDWPALSGTTLVQVGLWCALLWFVRQRDHARAELNAAKFEYVVAPPGLRESDRIWEWRRDLGTRD